MLFKNINDLASLPYFRLKADKLFLRKEIIGHSIIDMHTHLGWHYLMTPPINLWKKTETRHFFPSTIPFETDRYTAYDFTNEAKRKCEQEVVRAAYDTTGYSATHTIPNILDEMNSLNIDRAITLAIDYPVMSQNSREQLEAVNRETDSKKHLGVFISLHPLQTNKELYLKEYLSQGGCGIKLHPQMQLFRPSMKTAYPIYELAGKYKLPILFHTGLSPISPAWQKRFVQPKDYEKVFADFPGNTFIIGHAGGAGGFEWAAQMAARYPHVVIELSGQPPPAIEYLIDHVDPTRILYGSDWPFYPMALPLAKTLLATEKNKNVRKLIFRDNAIKLLKS